MTDPDSARSVPLIIDDDLLARVARTAEPHHHAMLQAIRTEFGDNDAPTILTIALAMLFGTALKTIPHAERAPDGIALVWTRLGVPFTLEAKRVQ